MLEEHRAVAVAAPQYMPNSSWRWKTVSPLTKKLETEKSWSRPSANIGTSETSYGPTTDSCYISLLVIPVSKWPEILSKLHVAHQGIERSKRRARQVVFWPGISNDITNTVRVCVSCQEALPSLQREPLAHDSLPTRIFEDVSVDIFSFAGNHYFTDADRLSGWPTVHAVFNRDYRTKDGTQILTRNFVDLGGPVRMRSYGGPQFDSA